MSNTAVAVTTSGNVLFSLINSTSKQASFTITTPVNYTVTAVRQDA